MEQQAEMIAHLRQSVHERNDLLLEKLAEGKWAGEIGLFRAAFEAELILLDLFARMPKTGATLGPYHALWQLLRDGQNAEGDISVVDPVAQLQGGKVAIAVAFTDTGRESLVGVLRATATHTVEKIVSRTPPPAPATEERANS